LTDRSVMALAVDGNNVFAGTHAGVFRCSNNDTVWTSAIGNLPSANIFALATLGGNLFAGSSNNGVFLSTNNGADWSAANTNLTNAGIRALAVAGSSLFAATTFGVFRTTDDGLNWTEGKGDISSLSAWALCSTDSGVFAGGTGGSVFVTGDGGTNWMAFNIGLTNADVRGLAVVGSDLFAGTFGGGVWRCPLSEFVTRVDVVYPTPSRFQLLQNYPNPFNPSTTISFMLPARGKISLKVFNLLGEEVTTLREQEYPPGHHKVEWDASGLSSGVYYYRLQAGTTAEMKKMLLVR
jgi:hypothetical protein